MLGLENTRKETDFSPEWGNLPLFSRKSWSVRPNKSGSDEARRSQMYKSREEFMNDVFGGVV